MHLYFQQAPIHVVKAGLLFCLLPHLLRENSSSPLPICTHTCTHTHTIRVIIEGTDKRLMALDTKYYTHFAPKEGKVRNLQPITLRERGKKKEKASLCLYFSGENQLSVSKTDYLFFLQQDQTDNRNVDVSSYCSVLEQSRYLKKTGSQASPHVVPFPCPRILPVTVGPIVLPVTAGPLLS